MKRKDFTNTNTYGICHDLCGMKSTYVTNITDKAAAVKKIQAALMICAKALATTLGPNGSTTIIEETTGKHLITKDGLDVITRIRLSDPVANIVLHELRHIASNQVRAVGDGSTSAIIIANALYYALTNTLSDVFNKFSGKDIVDVLTCLAKYLELELISRATPVSEDLHEIEQMAAVSTNNDTRVGANFKEMYKNIGAYGFITQDTTKNIVEDAIEYVNGVNWTRGYIEGHYGEGHNEGIVTYSRPRVLVCKGRLNDDDIYVLSQALAVACGNNSKDNKNQGNLIIIANSYSESIKAFLSNNRHLGAIAADNSDFAGKTDFNVTAVDIDSVLQESVDKLQTIALLSGCQIYDKNAKGIAGKFMINPDAYLGRLDSAKITRNDTYLYTDDSLLDENAISEKNKVVSEIVARLGELRNVGQFGETENKEQYHLQLRLAALTRASAVYHVSGFTQEERNSRSRLIEDAIYSTQSAMRLGYIYGGNLAIPIIIRDNKDKIVTMLRDSFKYLTKLGFDFETFVDTIYTAFTESYYLVLANSSLPDPEAIVDECIRDDKFFNLKTHEYESLTDTVIINSVGTDIEIMKSCFSIIGMLVTSNQILTSMFLSGPDIVES